MVLFIVVNRASILNYSPGRVPAYQAEQNWRHELVINSQFSN